FPDVMRQQIDQQLGDAIDELHRLWERTDVAGDRRMPSGQVFEAGDVVWIGQKANVEDQIAVGRYTMTVAEAGHVDHDFRFVPLAAELLADELPQFMHRELGGVDDQVRHRANGRELLALRANAP